jgi:hypothetical protein
MMISLLYAARGTVQQPRANQARHDENGCLVFS